MPEVQEPDRKGAVSFCLFSPVLPFIVPSPSFLILFLIVFLIHSSFQRETPLDLPRALLLPCLLSDSFVWYQAKREAGMHLFISMWVPPYLQDPFYWSRVINASNRGTLMELGISPIVTSGSFEKPKSSR